MTEIEFPLGPAVDSAAAFAELVAWLPSMLNELLAPPTYNAKHRPPRDAHGIYLFTEEGKHLYVGRTGITALARAGHTASGTSFRGPI